MVDDLAPKGYEIVKALYSDAGQKAMGAGHAKGKPEIADLLLYRGSDTMLDRAAWISGVGALVKVATVVPGNVAIGKPTVNGSVTLYDDLTGELRGLVDFHLVTKWKTAGDSLLAASRLARPDARRFLLVGAGKVAASMVEAYRALVPAAEFTVWSRSRASAEAMGLPVADDLVAARLRAAGAILIGKTNTPEWGHGSHSFNPVFGVTRNPYDLTRTAGGSSGGAAAALATRMVALADGSDMMGSLRNPAAFCNVYGFRPSYGLVPGMAQGDTFLATMATEGPMARSVEDVALMLEVLAGRPERKILVLNKVDVAKKEPLLVLAEELTGKVEFSEVFFVSAQSGDGVPEMKAALAALMPQGDWIYPEDQVSDASERLMAAEITREQLYKQLHEELPYDSAVRPEKYVERKDGSVEIHQQIVVTRDNQRAIVLGKGGSKIKAIGAAARAELMEVLGVKVHLFLHVKVLENWAEDKELFEEIGLDWVR